MSNEIQIVCNVRVANGSFLDTFQPGTQQWNQAAIGKGGGVQTIGTSLTPVTLTPIGTPGLVIFQNLDPTNYIDLGVTNGATMIPLSRLDPGKMGFWPAHPSVSLQAQANGAPCKLDVRAYEK